MSESEDEIAKTTFRMPKSMLRQVKHYATDHDMTDTDVFVQALKEWLAKKK